MDGCPSGSYTKVEPPGTGLSWGSRMPMSLLGTLMLSAAVGLWLPVCLRASDHWLKVGDLSDKLADAL